MKITRSQLKQIIEEELAHIMNEQGTTPNPTGAPRNWPDEEAEGVLARQLRLALKHNDMILYRGLKTSDQPYLDAYWLEAAAQRERDYDNAQQSAEFERAFEAGKAYFDDEGTYHPHPPTRPGRAGYEIQKDAFDHDHMSGGYPAPMGYAPEGQSWEELNPDEGRHEQMDERKKSKSRYYLYKAGKSGGQTCPKNPDKYRQSRKTLNEDNQATTQTDHQRRTAASFARAEPSWPR